MTDDDTGRNAEWETLRMELMDTLAVSELPETSMTCATLRALLDILSINMTRGRPSPTASMRLAISDEVRHVAFLKPGCWPPTPIRL